MLRIKIFFLPDLHLGKSRVLSPIHSVPYLWLAEMPVPITYTDFADHKLTYFLDLA